MSDLAIILGIPDRCKALALGGFVSLGLSFSISWKARGRNKKEGTNATPRATSLKST